MIAVTPGTWDQPPPDVWPGSRAPLGATWGPEATNFAVYAPRATRAWVCLFDDEGAETRLEMHEQSLGVWHCAVPGVAPGTRYGYRTDGPWDLARGLRFNPEKLLLDPCARAVCGELRPGPAVHDFDLEAPDRRSRLDSAGHVPVGVVVHDEFDWGDDAPLRTRWHDTVVYELHVKGMTARHPLVPPELRGTYAGLASPPVLDYLTDLGVTAVELLPVHQSVPEPELTRRGLTNYWGYNTLGFFAPHHAYSSAGDRGQQVTEFKAMVKAFHAAGLEVILDVVYNHTAEGGPDGPTLSLRGLDDLGYYQRVRDEHGKPVVPESYWDVTGCGNTVDLDGMPALTLVMDSLRYWVDEMHVDGFRFDLLPAITRTEQRVDMRSRLLTAIGQDPVLRHVKLIAEPWDASMDGYRVGEFPPPWVEWNDRYRDTMRDFWRGRSAGIREVATRLAGSSDLYADDGFTMRDLVSYLRKHNHANGEDNRDGTDDNRSWNHGAEGETDDPGVNALRRRQVKNLMASLCMSAGVPMLTAGDERGRTQRGNNNAYCQDNEISWVDWSEEGSWADVHAFTRAALHLRRNHPALRQRHWFEGRPAVPGGPKDLAWLHPDGREMQTTDWLDDSIRVVGMFVSGDPLKAPGPRGEQLRDRSFMLWANAEPDPVEITLPRNQWVQTGEVVLSTDPATPAGTPVRAGQVLVQSGRSVLVMRQSG